MDECTTLATRLSSNFLDTSPFLANNSTSLSGYLRSHGVLLTMCTSTRGCTLGMDDTHLAGSWINQKLGLAVLPVPSNVGMVLNPETVDIQCIFPIDGGSDDRDHKGCGPRATDPQFGSQRHDALGPRRLRRIQRKLREYKNFNFGNDTEWTDIDCFDFFANLISFQSGMVVHCADPTRGIHDCPFPNAEEDSLLRWNFTSVYPILQNEYEQLMGHPVCHDVAAVSDGHHFTLQLEPQSWRPNHWQQMVDVQISIQSETPAGSHVFNEVVMSIPTRLGLRSLVEAVFYKDSKDEETRYRARQFALSQSRILGKRHVLKLSLEEESFAEHPLFVCDHDNTA